MLRQCSLHGIWDENGQPGRCAAGCAPCGGCARRRFLMGVMPAAQHMPHGAESLTLTVPRDVVDVRVCSFDHAFEASSSQPAGPSLGHAA